MEERVEKLMHPGLGSGGHDIIAKYSDKGMMDSMPKKKFVFKKKEPVAEPVAEPAEPKKKFVFKKKEPVAEPVAEPKKKFVFKKKEPVEYPTSEKEAKGRLYKPSEYREAYKKMAGNYPYDWKLKEMLNTYEDGMYFWKTPNGVSWTGKNGLYS